MRFGVSASFASLSLALACTRANPAFEDGGEELGSEGADTLVDEGSGEGMTDVTTSADVTTSDDVTSEATSETETTLSGSETTDTGGIACVEPDIACDGGCVDPEFDETFCGSCDVSCSDDESCVEGSCVAVVDRLVFVSSSKHDGAWLGGIFDIDELCQALADQHGYPGVFFAWNSVAMNSPSVDFEQDGRYVRADGMVVADSYVELVDGTLDHPINVTESGAVATKPAEQAWCPGIDDAVWSGTTPGGEYAGEPTCGGWMTAGPLAKGWIGRMNATDGAWSQVDCQMACNVALPVYCVQQ